MQNEGRMDFINKTRGIDMAADGDNLSKENRLREISFTRVSDFNEFDRLFNEAVERQHKAKEEELHGKKETKGKEVIKDDAFADLDKELGF